MGPGAVSAEGAAAGGDDCPNEMLSLDDQAVGAVLFRSCVQGQAYAGLEQARARPWTLDRIGPAAGGPEAAGVSRPRRRPNRADPNVFTSKEEFTRCCC